MHQNGHHIHKTGNAIEFYIGLTFSKVLGVKLTGNNESCGGSASAVLLRSHIHPISTFDSNIVIVGKLVAGNIIGECMVTADKGTVTVHPQAEDIRAGHSIRPIIIQGNIPVLFRISLLIGLGGLIIQISKLERKGIVRGCCKCSYRDADCDEQRQCDNCTQNLIILHTGYSFLLYCVACFFTKR